MTKRLLMTVSAAMACAFAVGQGVGQPATSRSPLGPKFPSASPVLGARGLKPLPMNEGDVSEIRRIMSSQPFQVGIESHASGPMRAMSVSGRSALILYDSAGGTGYIGNLYARQLSSLCSHFSMNCNIMPVENYTPGAMSYYTATFYFGTTKGNKLPPAFLADALAAPKPLVWMGYNLWEVAWTASGANNPTFSKKFGFEFNYMDGLPYSTVTYKGVALTANPDGVGLANLSITNTAVAKTVATATVTRGTTTPYLIHSGNLWFTAENPLENAGANRNPDRAAVIEDSIHDVINDGMVTGQHRAIIRIDQVHPQTQASSLIDIANYMGSTPYAVCVVPHYKDPLGHYTGGSAEDKTISDYPALSHAISTMVSKGAQVVMEGDTHQYDKERNPNNGVSTDDLEFYRVRPLVAGDVEGQPTYGNFEFVGPATEDSTAWVQSKIRDGINIMVANQWTVTGWCTPMYMASPTDYKVFQSSFQYSLCRGNTFTTDPNGNVYFAPLSTPWPILDDIGMIRMPENVGYFSTTNFGVWEAIPNMIVQVAKSTKNAIRDGWVGCYFHSTYSVDLLADIVDGMKSNGFTFVNPGYQWVGQ